MSNGPAPGPESLAIMQRFVDGELTIEQAIEETDAMLLARYAPKASSEAPIEAVR